MSNEKEVKKKQVATFHLMGFTNQEIADALKLDEKTVRNYKEELYKEVKETYKDGELITNDILSHYKRLQEEAWKLFENDKNASNLKAVNDITGSKADRLAKLGFLKEKAQEISISGKTEVNIPELILLARKISDKV